MFTKYHVIQFLLQDYGKIRVRLTQKMHVK